MSLWMNNFDIHTHKKHRIVIIVYSRPRICLYFLQDFHTASLYIYRVANINQGIIYFQSIKMSNG